uniref:Uncharacterized protein n=1 Tax=Cacopsylla melanoneura TaxID=428564 RepID=A0A8D8VUI1_9HEMI
MSHHHTPHYSHHSVCTVLTVSPTPYRSDPTPHPRNPFSLRRLRSSSPCLVCIPDHSLVIEVARDRGLDRGSCVSCRFCHSDTRLHHSIYSATPSFLFLFPCELVLC